MKELICIVCPRGCPLRVEEEKGYLGTGNFLPTRRGIRQK